jgi:hypothetical protein
MLPVWTAAATRTSVAERLLFDGTLPTCSDYVFLLVLKYVTYIELADHTNTMPALFY